MPPAKSACAYDDLLVKKRVLSKLPHNSRVWSVANDAHICELRYALAIIGWQGPVDATKETTWQNLVCGLEHWLAADPADFECRVPYMIERYRTAVKEHREFLDLCKWAQCTNSACEKWRRCPPEYLATLEEPLEDIEDWTCMALDRECDEDDDLMDDDELWNGECDGVGESECDAGESDATMDANA